MRKVWYVDVYVCIYGNACTYDPKNAIADWVKVRPVHGLDGLLSCTK